MADEPAQPVDSYNADIEAIQKILDNHKPSMQVEILKRLRCVAEDKRMAEEHAYFTSGATA